MLKIASGHYQAGIYHARRDGRSWVVTVEDGKGFPFIPIVFPTLRAIRSWIGV